MTRTIKPHPTDPNAALVELTLGHWAIIDIADAADVGRWNWSAYRKKTSRTVYAKRTVNRRKEGRQWEVSLHRFLWEKWKRPSTPEIDHRDGDGLNNRSGNLRAATHGQNKKNNPLQKNNTTGFTGVALFGDRWRARIYVNGKTIRLGSHPSCDAAITARRAAERKYFGQFARRQA